LFFRENVEVVAGFQAAGQSLSSKRLEITER
jgi:hypothetical protein